MTDLMTHEQVKCMVAGKGTKIATVTFRKIDGSKRIINGSSHIVGSERGQVQGEAMRARGQIPIYELASKKWKSFYADCVEEIK
jgi:hypothetical protein